MDPAERRMSPEQPHKARGKVRAASMKDVRSEAVPAKHGQRLHIGDWVTGLHKPVDEDGVAGVLEVEAMLIVPDAVQRVR